eukprot:292588-Pleurochrysis_carterae.AAC.2
MRFVRVHCPETGLRRIDPATGGLGLERTFELPVNSLSKHAWHPLRVRHVFVREQPIQRRHVNHRVIIDEEHPVIRSSRTRVRTERAGEGLLSPLGAVPHANECFVQKSLGRKDLDLKSLLGPRRSGESARIDAHQWSVQHVGSGPWQVVEWTGGVRRR